MISLLAPIETSVPDNPLIPPLPDLIWGTIVFATIAIVFAKFVLPKLTKVLDERAEKIEGGIKAGEEARAEAAALKAGFEAEIAAARREAAEMRDSANEEAKTILAEARVKANQEAERIVTNAQRQIEAERQAAEISLRTDVGLMASELASRIVGESLRDGDMQARVIDRFLAELEADRSASQKVEG